MENLNDEIANNTMIYQICSDMCLGSYQITGVIGPDEKNQWWLEYDKSRFIQIPIPEQTRNELYKTIILIRDKSGMTRTELLYAMCLLRKIWAQGSQQINPIVLQTLVVGACIVAQKMIVDGAYPNWWWARQLEVPLECIHSMENKILNALDYKTHVNKEEIETMNRQFHDNK
ncbi:MAG: hypothetical protein EZS28_014552 [Streblomastix strix]|uniref:Cyclin N-terminal domain-containing protein n=1 Tax=Streblomastix strix TaxID=222440 RepID=A0A5J4W5A0_9EUKA|nr:MAG: hypothetical protein EZS28_014552 [Streblomastix strix]